MAERRSLYHTVYDERLRRIPNHPLAVRAQAAGARARPTHLPLVLALLPPGGNFLEIGPGDCALALRVAEHAGTVLAVDVSDGLVQAGARPENFELRLSDGIAVPAALGSVDLAFSSQVMEHLHPDDALEQLRNVYAALKPDGAYLCITPNRLAGPWDVSRGFDPVATGLHLKEYTTSELATALLEAGFARVQVVLSYHGLRLSPRLPVAVVSAVERGLEQLPRALGWRLAHALTAVKVIGYK
jgi:SAM-dependent methyltransferase